MLRRFDVSYALLSLVADALAVGLALRLAAWARPDPRWLPFSRPMGTEEPVPWFLYAAAPLLWVATLWQCALYDPRAAFRTGDEVRVLSVGTAFASLAGAGVLYLSSREVSRWLFVTFVAMAWLLLVGWRLAARLLARATGAPGRRERRVLVVGDGEAGRHLGGLVTAHERWGLRLLGYLTDDPASAARPNLGPVARVREVARATRADDVVIALPAGDGRVPEVLAALLDVPLQVWLVPEGYRLALDRPAVESFAGVPLLGLRAGPLTEPQRVLKRLFDLVVGSALLVGALPLMALVALAVRLDSPGPVLIRQPRVGENGRPFQMYKFRSMVADAEARQAHVIRRDAAGRILHKHPDDPRVTRVGRFIRRTSLDELPQLVNVLKGEMSLVGPRPELPWLVERYEPWQRRRLVVPQGITGWWQVNGRSSKPMHLHTEEDLYYVANYSFWLDLRILWKTIWVVLARRGAH